MTTIIHRVRVVAGDIKLAHSVFALPFALLGAVMALRPPAGHAPDSRAAASDAIPALTAASNTWVDALTLVALVVAAMVTARTAAMIANRLLDADLDARNPRTKGRAIPAGRVSKRDAALLLVLSSAGFIAVCGAFGVLRDNWWPLLLSLPVLAWITLYGLFKRFTWACHLWLGASLALSVPAAALAVDPAALAMPSIWWLALAVLAWVAGFDVIYALQDIEVDRAERLHSVPARFGWGGALAMSRSLHAVAVASLVMAWWSDVRLGVIFAAAVVAASLLLLVEHATVRRWGTSRMALTFFTINGCVSLLLGAAGIVGVLLAG
ncbi:MAG: putative 4-hydroxybenzoate polyprenyltransferase [Phycisphaeraceae bacterium]|nr:putative 4-hydroxybenzoate polyprenyltransferase [Phycisphaeraceae bacterium]